MTLPSRKKHPIIALTTLHRAILASRQLPPTLALTISMSLSGVASAQAPAWHPNRQPANAQANSLSYTSASPTEANSAPGYGQAGAQSNKVVFRWVNQSSSEHPTVTAAQAFEARPEADYANQVATATITAREAFDDGNPLRSKVRAASEGSVSASMVRQANYQQPGLSDPFADDAPPPSATPLQFTMLQEELPTQPSLDPNSDPLDIPEFAPPPLQNDTANQIPASPFSNQPSASDLQAEPIAPGSPFDNSGLDGDGLPDLKRIPGNSLSCEDMRSRLRDRSLKDIDLNVSPEFRNRSMTLEQLSREAEVRDWTDVTGMVIATGRMLNFQHDQVFIETPNGALRKIAFNLLSDLDTQYVADVWGLPVHCGAGYEPFVGRNFIQSEVQWKAPGACHKPLYFEDVQLERYGHETGPVLQPLLSTAHFVGNLALLPYKMGIHPPNECQYSLGYYSPGSCAPYMLQPFPWSLRGALAEAGAAVGGAALIP